MTNIPEGRVGGETGGQEADDWVVPQRETKEPEKFEVDGIYSPDDFLRILREQIGAALEKSPSETAGYISVLEHWEKRVTDLVGEAGELAGDILVGFVEGEDEKIRLKLMFKGEQA